MPVYYVFARTMLFSTCGVVRALMPKIETLIEIALEAGAEILAVYAEDFAVAIKPDASPVTEADTRAEAIILARLGELAPDVPVIAEEATAAGIVPVIAETFFLVDPLDGSKEFIARNGEFTVNIALITDGVPVMGVVYAPALGRIWWGVESQGAHAAEVVDGVLGAAVKLSCQPCGPEGFRVVASRSHAAPEVTAYLETVAVADYVAAGSSLKFCMLAQGQADLYPRFSRTMEWDTAAGDAVLRAAGGHVRTLDEKLLSYGKRDQADDTDFANPPFIASVTARR